MKRILGCIRRADERYHMLRPGDRVCVGVSGGKDSLLLLYGLKLYQRFSKTPYELIGVAAGPGMIRPGLWPSPSLGKGDRRAPRDHQDGHRGDRIPCAARKPSLRPVRQVPPGRPQ